MRDNKDHKNQNDRNAKMSIQTLEVLRLCAI